MTKGIFKLSFLKNGRRTEFDPDIDWVVILSVSVLIVVVVTIYSVSMFYDIRNEDVKEGDVIVQDITFDVKRLESVISQFNIRKEKYEQAINTPSIQLKDPSKY